MEIYLFMCLNDVIGKKYYTDKAEVEKLVKKENARYGEYCGDFWCNTLTEYKEERRFQIVDNETNKSTEEIYYFHNNEIDTFIMAVMHTEARNGKKVTAYISKEYYEKLLKGEELIKNEEYFNENAIEGIPFFINDEQEFEVILRS